MFKIIKSGKVPTEFMNNIEPEVIGLLIKEIAIYKVRQKGQRSPYIVVF